MALADSSTYTPQAGAGDAQQAIARKNARRGGTPNAPEVDDEPAPQGATGVNGGPSPTLRALPGAVPGGASPTIDTGDMADQYAAGNKAGGPLTGIALAARSGVGSAIANTVDSVREGVGNLARFAAPLGQAVQAFTTGDTSSPTPAVVPPNAAAPAAQPTVPPGGAIASPPAPAAPDTVPAPGAHAIPPGVGRTGPIPGNVQFDQGSGYSGTGAAPAAGAVDPIAAANRAAAGQIAVMDARDAAGLQQTQQQQAAQNNVIIARSDATKAARDASVANFQAQNAPEVLHGGIGTRTAAATYNNLAAAANQKAAGLQAIAANAQGATVGAGARNPIADEASSSATANANAKAADDETENEALAPTKLTAAQQAVGSGALALTHAKRLDALQQAVADATTPEAQQHAVAALRALQGQNKVAIVDVDTGATQVDPMSGKEVPIYKKGAIDLASGQLLGQGTAAAGNKPPSKGFGQFSEGQQLKGKDGKLYIVKNGQPVLQ